MNTARCMNQDHEGAPAVPRVFPGQAFKTSGLICASCQDVAAGDCRFSKIDLAPTPNQRHDPRGPALTKEGRFAIVTNVERGMRWTR
jgi:hypothetical protein